MLEQLFSIWQEATQSLLICPNVVLHCHLLEDISSNFPPSQVPEFLKQNMKEMYWKYIDVLLSRLSQSDKTISNHERQRFPL